jgi:agmatine deiminase
MHTPKELGFYFPPEWHSHEATWFTFPHNNHSWQGDKLAKMYDNYCALLMAVSAGEKVCVNVNSEQLKTFVSDMLQKKGADLGAFEFLVGPTNDAWCRDHGPAFVINPNTKQKMIVDWEYNAWGGKYPPFNNDNDIPKRIANYRNLPMVSPGIVMEGGSVEFNGAGTILTSRSCLLNQNRNPQLNPQQIEQYLCEYYGAEQVLWVEDGIVGDDTDGHIDDTARFINEDTVVAAVELNKADENYHVLQKNLKMLQKMRLLNGKQLNVIELPMPKVLVIDDFRCPASYANFLICNAGIILPTFNQKADQVAVDILEKASAKPVIPLDSSQIIWGQGSFHCLSQQEPSA